MSASSQNSHAPLIRFQPNDPLEPERPVETLPPPEAVPGTPGTAVKPTSGPLPPPALYAPGTETGKTFRLRGKGVPSVDGYGHGDLQVQVVPEVPVKL